MLTCRRSLPFAVIVSSALLTAAMPTAPLRNDRLLRQPEVRALAASPSWMDLVRRAGDKQRKIPPRAKGRIATPGQRDNANGSVPASLRQLPSTASLRDMSVSLAGYGRTPVRKIWNPETKKYDIREQKSPTAPGLPAAAGGQAGHMNAGVHLADQDQRQAGGKGKAPQDGPSRPSKAPRFDPFGLAVGHTQPRLGSPPKSNPHSSGHAPAGGPYSDPLSPSRSPQHWPNFFDSDSEGSPRAGSPTHHHRR